MVEEDSESALLLRAAGRTIRPSPDDTQQIREAVAVVTEIFESLIQVATDDRTVAGLQAGGNGEALGPTPGDLQDIAQELSGALTALSDNDLDIDMLKTIAIDLKRHLTRARNLFEVRSEQFTSRPVDQAEPTVIAGALFAGLSDAVGALSQLLELLEEVANQSVEGHGGT
jgi:hypothetical protein